MVTSVSVLAQKYTLSGIISDADSKETLVGANVFINELGTGTVTDFDGFFQIQLENGTYNVKVSFVGYDAKEYIVTINNAPYTLNVEMGGMQILNEVVITADIAVDRETPVAFSNIKPKQLNEELAAQDLVMVLNSTPGAYATQAGGGDGDARISIRGFNQRNVAVMLDGIPVNDMENGWVYWSNWFGLDLVTQTMQVQRGLGASKLSIPSVGGTINILTKGIDAKKSLRFRQEIGNNGFTRSTLGLTTGRTPKGWGVSAALSYKEGNGWVDGTFTQGLFYYLRVDKQIGNHLISLTGFGAPQQHGQRPFTTDVGVIDSSYAVSLDVPSEDIAENLPFSDMGLRYNSHWGYRDGKVFNTRKNYYHKPQISLRHSWEANDRLFWSNVAYLSLGNGGGTSINSSNDGSGLSEIPITEDGQFNLDAAVANNVDSTLQLIDGSFQLAPDLRSEAFIRSSVNNHFWIGYLSTLNYNINSALTFSGGLDGRFYRGDHYREIHDLLGGEYFTYRAVQSNYQVPVSNGINEVRLYEGDKYNYFNSGFVRWTGAFGLLEYKKNRISAFLNISGAITGYALEDYFKPKVVELPDTTFFLAYGDTVNVDGNNYHINSSEAKNQRIDWINLPTYTIKGGASYDLNQRNTVFFNAGYLSKAQRFDNVIDDRFALEFSEYDNEVITAVELGYNFRSATFSANVNGYYTLWDNKPVQNTQSALIPDPVTGEVDEDSDRIPYNIAGISAAHRGIEIDFAYQPSKKISIEGLASIGDWIWTSGGTAYAFFQESIIDSLVFDARGVHVGDAAQLQFGGLVRYEPIRGLYFKVRGTYFGKNYAQFNPEDLTAALLTNSDGVVQDPPDSWRMPDYLLWNAHAGYSFKIKNARMSVRLNILNVLDTRFISDARNNDTFSQHGELNGFNAQSATVHFGQGRRWTASLGINL